MSVGVWEARNTYRAYCMLMDGEITDDEFLGLMHQLYFDEYALTQEEDNAVQ